MYFFITSSFTRSSISEPQHNRQKWRIDQFQPYRFQHCIQGGVHRRMNSYWANSVDREGMDREKSIAPTSPSFCLYFHRIEAELAAASNRSGCRFRFRLLVSSSSIPSEWISWLAIALIARASARCRVESRFDSYRDAFPRTASRTLADLWRFAWRVNRLTEKDGVRVAISTIGRVLNDKIAAATLYSTIRRKSHLYSRKKMRRFSATRYIDLDRA